MAKPNFQTFLYIIIPVAIASFILGYILGNIPEKEEITTVPVTTPTPTSSPQPTELPTQPEEEKIFNLILDFVETTSTTVSRGGEVVIKGKVTDNLLNPIGSVEVNFTLFSPTGKIVNKENIKTEVNGTFIYTVKIPIEVTVLGQYPLEAQSTVAPNRYSLIKIIQINVVA